jgi:hypothetical protein
MVVHASDPSYAGGLDRRINAQAGFRLKQETLPEKYLKQKRAEGMV